MAAGRRTAQQGRRTRRNIVVSLSLFRAPVRLAPPYSFSELPEHTFRDLGGMSAALARALVLKFTYFPNSLKELIQILK